MGRPIRGRCGGLAAIACTMALVSGLSVPGASAQVEPPEPTCAPIAKTKLRLRKVDDGIGNERLLFRGEMAIDEAIPLDLSATGIRFQMIGGDGVTLLDVTLPAVSFGIERFGWVTSGNGTVWSWLDRDAAVSGFRRVVFKRPARSNAVRVVLFGQDFEYALPALPITIRVLIPTLDGAAVLCGQQIAQEVECFFRNQGNKLICR